MVNLPAPVPLSANTDYYLAVKQNAATAVNVANFDVDAAAHFAATGSDSFIAYKSTAGAAPAVQNSGKRRWPGAIRISSIDLTPAAAGGSSGVVGS